MDLLIRKAGLSDLNDITEIYNEAILTTTSTFDTEPKTLEERKHWLESHDSLHPILVCEFENDIAGWASLSKWSDRSAYHKTVENSVYIKEKYRGHGFGTLLLQKILNNAKENGFHTVIARIADNNPASIRLHESAGFEKIGVMKEVGEKFNRLVDVMIMQKIL
jgi:phosphinothricin acetyltransferase